MEKSKVILFSIIAVLLILASLAGLRFTGFTVYNDNPSSSINDSVNIAREEAVSAISWAEKIIVEMNNSGFFTTYVNDKLIEAKRALDTADYVEVMKNYSASALEKAAASKALELIDWKNVNYNGVLVYTNAIIQAQKDASFISDSIFAFSLKLENEKKIGTDIISSQAILEKARQSFTAERYNESINFLEQARTELENKKAETARLSVFKAYFLSFFLQYWYYFLAAFILVVLISVYSYGKIKKYNLFKKITHMKAEQQVLTTLMIRTQNERYKENKISGLVYNIRMKKYRDRINEIKETLPVLEARFKGKKSAGKVVKIS